MGLSKDQNSSCSESDQISGACQYPRKNVFHFGEKKAITYKFWLTKHQNIREDKNVVPHVDICYDSYEGILVKRISSNYKEQLLIVSRSSDDVTIVLSYPSDFNNFTPYNLAFRGIDVLLNL